VVPVPEVEPVVPEVEPLVPDVVPVPEVEPVVRRGVEPDEALRVLDAMLDHLGAAHHRPFSRG
jgi:hypothetical protein